MRDNKIKHGLKNPSDGQQVKDTYSTAISNETLNLVYYLILNKPYTLLEISARLGLTLETIAFVLMELRTMGLLADNRKIFTCRKTNLSCFYYKSIARKEGKDE